MEYTTEIESVLPCCGLVLRHSASTSEPKDWEMRTRERINYWLKVRTDRHRCDLVSEDNPMGQIPGRPGEARQQGGETDRRRPVKDSPAQHGRRSDADRAMSAVLPA